MSMLHLGVVLFDKWSTGGDVGSAEYFAKVLYHLSNVQLFQMYIAGADLL